MESDGWHASRYCRAELEIAAELHKPVVHIDVHDIHPDEAVAIVEHALSGVDPHPAGPRRPPGAQREAGSQWPRPLRPRRRRPARTTAPRRTEGLAATAGSRDFLTASEARDRFADGCAEPGPSWCWSPSVSAGSCRRSTSAVRSSPREQAAVSTAAARAHYRTLEDPYTGLRMAADEVREGTTAHWRRPRSSRPTFRYPERKPYRPAGVAPSWSSPTRRRPFPRWRRHRRGPRSERSAGGRAARGDVVSPGRRPMGVTVRAANAGIAAVGTASGAVVVRGGARRSTTIEPDVDHGAVTALDVERRRPPSRSPTTAPASSACTTLQRASCADVSRSEHRYAASRLTDGRTLAVGSGNASSSRTSPPGSTGSTCAPGTNPVRAVSWSADGTSVWAITGEHRVSQWRWRDGHRLADDRSAWFVSRPPRAPTDP